MINIDIRGHTGYEKVLAWPTDYNRVHIQCRNCKDFTLVDYKDRETYGMVLVGTNIWNVQHLYDCPTCGITWEVHMMIPIYERWRNNSERDKTITSS